ncbi:MAG: hypothetical protein AB7D06_14950 [Pedobacter sp.]
MKTRSINFILSCLLSILFFLPASVMGEIKITPDQVDSYVKNISESGDFVFAYGRWKRVSGNRSLNKPPQINSVFIACDRQKNICEETIAELVTAQDEAMFDNPKLLIDKTTYRINDWRNGTIRATHGAHVADFELRISISDEIAERHWRETKSRGSATSDPRVFANWVLE